MLKNTIPFNLFEPFICYIIGKPGSGKSYLSVYVAKLLEEDSRHEGFIYTDVQGVFLSNKIRRFDMQEFLSLWTQELNDIKTAKHGDEHDLYWREKFKEKGYLASCFILDEVQNFLDVENPVWLRVLSYYRHYDMKIILMTQDLFLVHKKFKTTPDKFLKAQSADSRIGKDFKYTWYSFHMMREGNVYNDVLDRFTVPAMQEIFDSYDSGGKQRKKSVIPAILKTAMWPVLIIVGSLVYYFKWQYDVNKELNEKHKAHAEELQKDLPQPTPPTLQAQPTQITKQKSLHVEEEFVQVFLYAKKHNGVLLYYHDLDGNIYSRTRILHLGKDHIFFANSLLVSIPVSERKSFENSNSGSLSVIPAFIPR